MMNSHSNDIKCLAEAIHTIVHKIVSYETNRQNIIELPDTFVIIGFNHRSIPAMMIGAFPSESDIYNWLDRNQNILLEEYSDINWDKYILDYDVECCLTEEHLGLMAGIEISSVDSQNQKYSA